MAYNFEFAHEKYKNTEKEEKRFLKSRAAGFEAHYTKKQIDLLVNKDSCVLELGCGTAITVCIWRQMPLLPQR